MNQIVAIGANGLAAQSMLINSVSVNLANLSTAGFGRRMAQVGSNGSSVVRPPKTVLMGQTLGQGASLPLGGQELSNVPVFSNGMTPTSYPYDLAVNGPGFFQVQTASGQTAYTRAGAFRLDANRRLVMPNGARLLPPITIPLGATATVNPTGAVTATVNGVVTKLGQIQLAVFPNPQGLVDLGSGLYAPSANSGTPTVSNPGTGAAGTLVPEALNQSGVSLATNFVHLIEAQSAYNLSAKLISVGEVLDQKTLALA